LTKILLDDGVAYGVTVVFLGKKHQDKNRHNEVGTHIL